MDSSSKQRLDKVIVSPRATIAEAVACLDKAGTGAIVICSSGKTMYGLLTDGDIRRAILRGVSLEEPCGEISSRNPITAPQTVTNGDALHLMNKCDINQLPLVDEEGVLQDFLLRRDLAAEDDFRAEAGKRLDNVVISSGTSIIEAFSHLDKAGTGALVLCSTGRKLYGLLTDGDIRRAILHGIPLEDPCEKIVNQNPVTAQDFILSSDALHLMNTHDINHLPVVDGEGNVIELLLRKDLALENHLNLSAVIMAGGYGKRLLPLTEQVPKPMLPIGDRPLLERTIQKLRRSGIKDVCLTTHYLPENIRQYFGDGEAFGVRLSYSKEDQPLGTAGGLKLVKRMDRPFVVINGDILTGVSFQEMFLYHRKYRAEITVGVRKYDVKVPFGVVECDDVRITQLKEKPSLTLFINAGVYLLEPSACDYIPEGEHFDMTDLIQKLLDVRRTVVSFPIMEYWLDIGRHEDYQQAQEDVRNGKIK